MAQGRISDLRITITRSLSLQEEKYKHLCSGPQVDGKEEENIFAAKTCCNLTYWLLGWLFPHSKFLDETVWGKLRFVVSSPPLRTTTHPPILHYCPACLSDWLTDWLHFAWGPLKVAQVTAETPGVRSLVRSNLHFLVRQDGRLFVDFFPSSSMQVVLLN